MRDIFDSKASYMTDKVAILFILEPTLEAIEQARKLLDSITDTLILESMK